MPYLRWRPPIATCPLPPSMSDLVELESQLVRIWETVLRKRGIGVHDSFWDLGGNSLTALRLMRKVEQIAGQNLPITTLLQVPTISEMAALLRQSTGAKKWSSLVVIQPGGSIRDEDSIRAANDYGMAMVFTGLRHFRH